MFLKWKKIKKTGFFKKHRNQSAPLSKTPFCTCLKGSLTVEAAFVTPFAVFFLALLLGFFPVLELQQDMEKAMQCAVRKTAACSITDEQESALLAKGLFWKELRASDPPVNYVSGGYGGISLLESENTELYVELAASYRVQMPIRLFGRQGFFICQQVRARKWNGYDTSDGEGADSGQEKVYITESGHAYHKDVHCNYLDLSIRPVSRSTVEDLRSADGSKYHSCASCGRRNPDAGQVYITTYGTEYHTALDCSSLKRTIRAVDLEEVQGRTPCGKCYGK